MDEPLVSIVILNYNGGGVLDECLKSILSTDYPNFEVILVDNASNDHSVEIAENIRRIANVPFKIIKNSKNKGYTGGFNIGVNASKGEFVALVNNDVKVSKKWLRELVKVILRDPKIALCESKIIVNGNRVSYPGNSFSMLGFLRREPAEIDRGQYNKAHEIFSAVGVCYLLRKRAFYEVGGFDNNFFIQREIEDLCWRLRLRGYKVFFVPDSIVYHIARLHKAPMFYSHEIIYANIYHSTKNNLLIYFKNLSSINLLKYLPLMICLRVIDLLYLLIKHKRDILRIRISAYKFLIKNFNKIIYKRRYIQNCLKKVPNREVEKWATKPRLRDYWSFYTQFIA